MILQTADIFTQKTMNCSLTNRGKIMKKNILTIIIGLFFGIMLLVPLPNLILYVLFGIDVVALIVCAFIAFVEILKDKYFKLIPAFVMFWSFFNIGIVVCRVCTIACVGIIVCVCDDVVEVYCVG